MSNTAIKVLVIEDDADIRGLIIKVIKGMDLRKWPQKRGLI
jgi:two-component system, OmpR family, KDP operon response regulator KdpE